jgi:indole-3-glycerol phosphate synthase
MILDDIVFSTKKRVDLLKKQRTLSEIIPVAEETGAAPSFTEALNKSKQKDGLSFICEIKKASPSKGLIAKDSSGKEYFPYKDIAQEYEAAGAAAISILTEPDFFQGRNIYLQDISKILNIPLLRKDFVIDEYQIYEAKILGASAILLICAILNDIQLISFIKISKKLNISALVETHNEDEILRAVNAGASIIGVNNRNLKDFSVDIKTTIRLRKLIPANKIIISESGISSAEDVQLIKDCGVDGVLIGEALMKAEDKKSYLQMLKGKNGNSK